MAKNKIETGEIKNQPSVNIPNANKEIKEISVIPPMSIEGKFLHVKVGNKDRPADEPDLKDIEEKLDKLLKDNNINAAVFVTHHAVEIGIIESSKSL